MSQKGTTNLVRKGRSLGVPEGALRKTIIAATRKWFAALDAIVRLVAFGADGSGTGWADRSEDRPLQGSGGWRLLALTWAGPWPSIRG